MSFGQTAHILDAFDTLVKAAHQNSRNKGFWNGDPASPGGSADNVSVPTKLLLMVSEIAEAFEAYRKGAFDSPCDKDCTILDPEVLTPCTYRCAPCKGTGFIAPHHPPALSCETCDGTGFFTSDKGVRRLTNIEEELADVIIRIADFCGWRRIDLGRCVLAKMQYNLSRPHMHGKGC